MRDFPVGKAADRIGECREVRWSREYPARPAGRCTATLERDYHTDFASQSLPTVDPYRAHYLSTKRGVEEQRQNRPCEGPRDDFERRRMERDLGRVYVGDDIGGMTKKAQKAIEATKDVRPAKRLVSA
jgi:hypothetical protein